jgi:hypothetical protein
VKTSDVSVAHCSSLERICSDHLIRRVYQHAPQYLQIEHRYRRAASCMTWVGGFRGLRCPPITLCNYDTKTRCRGKDAESRRREGEMAFALHDNFGRYIDHRSRRRYSPITAYQARSSKVTEGKQRSSLGRQFSHLTTRQLPIRL